MGRGPEEIEGEAELLYRQAGFSTDEQAPTVLLARRLLGPESIRTVHAEALPGDGCLARVGGEWRIYVRRCAPPQAKRFALLHELAHWALGGEATELECDALSAALLVPRRAYLRVLAREGLRLPALALAFGTTETCVALRLGEATSEPLALITPATVRVRGQEWSWPSEHTIRSWVKGRAPGLKKARLRDDNRRFLLRAV